jgi:hypothetical protein
MRWVCRHDFRLTQPERLVMSSWRAAAQGSSLSPLTKKGSISLCSRIFTVASLGALPFDDREERLLRLRTIARARSFLWMEWYLELEEKVAERKLVTKAKALLETRHGMSEEEAHLQLQAISRKTRKPVREVARELIDPASTRTIP